MKHLIRLTDLKKTDVDHIFEIADKLKSGAYRDILKGKNFYLWDREEI